MNKSTSTSILGFAVIAALLTGCTPTSATVADNILVPALSAPANTPAAETPAVKTGQAVAEDAQLIEGQKAYPLADGTFIVVTATELFPAPVKADIIAKAKPFALEAGPNEAAAYGGSDPAAAKAHEALLFALAYAQKDSGRGVIVLYSGFGANVGPMWAAAASGHSSAPFLAQADRSKAVAEAKAWAAANDFEFLDF